MIREFTIFGLTVGTYSLMAFIAALTCAVMSWRPLRRTSLPRIGVLVLLAVTCISFLVCARLWNVAVNPDSYGDTKHWYTLRMTGFSMYGGLLGAFLVILACSKIFRISPAKIFDAFTVPGAVAFCLARVGCFLNGCCGGKRTDLPWGVIFPSETDELIKDVIPIVPIQRYAVHPTQLYELALALIGIPLCLWLVKLFRAGDGGRFYLYGTWFSTMRLAVLPMRSLPYPDVVDKFVYPALYLHLIALGIILFVTACRRGREERVKKDNEPLQT